MAMQTKTEAKKVVYKAGVNNRLSIMKSVTNMSVRKKMGKAELQKPPMQSKPSSRTSAAHGNENADPNNPNKTDPNKTPLPIEEAPSPLDFDKFFPWLCRKMGIVGNFHVKKMLQDPYIPVGRSPKPEKKSKKPSSETSLHGDSSIVVKTASHTKHSLYKDRDAAVPFYAYYDDNDRLVEFCIKGCNFICQKHIKVLSLILPFHSVMTKFSLKKCYVRQEVFYEIAQLLSVTNIAEVILDDTACIQGNYYVLLEYASNLKRLSLNRCNISDRIVQEIFKKLEGETAKMLQILELSSNFITDKGTLAIGRTLKTNRELLHLNLAGNKITDKGAKYIVRSLMKFPLTEDEVKERKERRMEFYKKKMRVFKQCYAEQLELRRRQFMSQSVGPSGRTTSFKPTAASRATAISRSKKEIDITQAATKMTNYIMGGGNFKDVYDDDRVIYEDHEVFCIGNFKFASLNLAYNHLGCIGLRAIITVLEYQAINVIPGLKSEKGLMRIVLDGNYINQKCEELEAIDYFMNKKTKDHFESNYNKVRSNRLFSMSTAKQKT